MFPSNNNDPVGYIDHSFLHKHFSTDHTKPDDLPFSFFHFPSPYYNQCELEFEEYDDIFRNQDHRYNDDQFLHQKPLMSTDNPVLINMPECRNITTNPHHQQQQQQVLQRKIPASKTNRHSKINTKNGLRDRRMRLSLDVARAFFGLQDLLDYDKPSRTVEWLLIQAKTEINKLIKFKSQVSEMNDSFGFAVSKSPSSTSEAVSGTDKADIGGSFSKGKGSKTERKDRVRERKTSFRPLARDLREKARERAKARTANIMWSRRLLCNETLNNDLNKFSSWSNQDQNKNNTSLQTDSMECSIFNCLQNAGINQEHQLTGDSVLWQTMGGLQ